MKKKHKRKYIKNVIHNHYHYHKLCKWYDDSLSDSDLAHGSSWNYKSSFDYRQTGGDWDGDLAHGSDW